MKRLLPGITAFLCFAVAGCGSAADKIIGVWSIAKAGGKEVPAEEAVTMTFTKDGKHIVKMKSEGKELTSEGAYKVEGDKLTVSGKGADGAEKSNIITIKNIAGDTMFLVKDGVELELRRK